MALLESVVDLPSVTRELLPVEALYTRDFSLRAYTSVKQGRKPIGFINDVAHDWTRSKTFMGGAWKGTFTMKAPIDILEMWFYERLGFHIEEHSFGSLTWDGFIWEMDLVSPDTSIRKAKRWKRRRRSYEELANKVRVDYTDPDTGNSGSSIWSEDAKSQARYGKKEEILQRNMDATNAQEAANDYLELFAYPRAELISFERPIAEPVLEVTVVGYIATASFRFTATDDGSTSTVGEWIEDIIDTDMTEFTVKARTVPNTRVIKQKISTPTRSLQLLEELLSLRDPSGGRFNLVIVGRGVWHGIWTNAPIGIIRQGVFRRLGGADLEQVPRLMQPGIYRDSDYVATATTHGAIVVNTFFDSPADFLLETVEVDADGGIVPRLGVYEDEESLRTFTFKDEDD